MNIHFFVLTLKMMKTTTDSDRKDVILGNDNEILGSQHETHSENQETRSKALRGRLESYNEDVPHVGEVGRESVDKQESERRQKAA